MSKPKNIKNISVITLLVSITSIFFTNSNNITKVNANSGINPTTSNTIISEFFIKDSSIDRSSIKTESDPEGNIIAVWNFSSFDASLPKTCSGIKQQRFSKNGIPMNLPTIVEESCNTSGGSAPSLLLSPAVATTELNDFIIVWKELEISSGINSIKGKYYTNNGTLQNSFTVNDTGTAQPISSPEIAIKKDSPRNATNFAVTWINCEIGNSCSNNPESQKVKLQMYTVNYSIPGSTVTKINADNLTINNDSSGTNFFPETYTPKIDISNDGYLVTWTGYNGYSTVTNQKAVWGRLIKTDGTAPQNIFTISDLNKDTSTLDITGIKRAFTESNISNVYYVAWNEKTTGTENTDDLYMRKIICNNTGVCAPATRSINNQNELITVRINTTHTTTKNHLNLTSYYNYNDSTRYYSKENSAYDLINVSWIEMNTSNEQSSIHQQNFNGLSRIGKENLVPSSTESVNPSNTMSKDGFYSIISIDSSTDNIKGNIFRSNYLRIGDETLIHAPEKSTPQRKPAVDTNSNGNYVIAYENYNSNNQDIVYALYNKDGTAIKNLSIANETRDGNQVEPSISFFNEDISSPDYGKFIISWTGASSTTSDNLFYRIFNADGTPAGNEVNINSSNLEKSKTSISAGKYGQFLICYIEGSRSNQAINYYYNNNTSSFTNTIKNTSNIVNSVKGIINPAANNNNLDQSQFVISWEEMSINQTFLQEGHLTSSTTASLNSVISLNGTSQDLSGAYLPQLSNIHNAPPGGVARNPFMYALSYVDKNEPNDSNLLINTYTFGQGILNQNIHSSKSPWGENNFGSKISIDKGTGNILSSWISYNNFWGMSSASQIYYVDNKNQGYSKDDAAFSTLDLSGDIISDTTKDSVTFSKRQPIFSTGSELVKLNKAITAISTSQDKTNKELTVNYSSPSGFQPTVGQNIQNYTNYGSVNTTIKSTCGYNCFIVNDEGTTINTDGNYDVLISSSTISSMTGYTQINFTDNSATLYNIGDTIIDLTTGATAQITGINSNDLQINNLNGTFNATDKITTYTKKSPISDAPQTIQINGQFLRFRVSEDNTQTYLEPFGPNFVANTYMPAKEAINGPAIGFDTRSENNSEKVVVFAFNSESSSFSPYMDNNGIYQQLFQDPFTIGEKEDANPNTIQEISSGGKYIIVPPLIDFGNVSRGNTSSVDIATLTPPYLQITDLDGSAFDLTLSMTDLTNSINGSDIIGKENFIIENNNGTDPAVSTNYPFTNVNDITLDPSTNPGNEANLSTTQTLLKKTNNNTGIYQIHPVFKLHTPTDATTGTYNGILTLTLN